MVAPGMVFAGFESQACRNLAVTPVEATWVRFGPSVPPYGPTVWQAPCL